MQAELLSRHVLFIFFSTLIENSEMSITIDSDFQHISLVWDLRWTSAYRSLKIGDQRGLGVRCV